MKYVVCITLSCGCLAARILNDSCALFYMIRLIITVHDITISWSLSILAAKHPQDNVIHTTYFIYTSIYLSFSIQDIK